MRIVCLQENLEQALLLCNKITSTKTQLPITKSVLISAASGKIELAATDLENTIKIHLAGKVEKGGQALVPIKTLTETVSNLPKEQTTIETEGTTLIIKAGERYKTTINGIPADEFPQLKEAAGERTLISGILPYVKKVAFAAATDESHTALTGILMQPTNKQTFLVATDGYRLSLSKTARTQTEKRETVGESEPIILPSRMLLEAARILAEPGKGDNNETENATVTLSKEKNQAVFSLGDVTLFTRLIEGPFPQYEKIIPQSFTTQVMFEREEFLRAVRLSAIFAKEAANIVKIKLGGKKVVLSANAPQVGGNVCEVEARFEGEENEIAFNSRFLLDFLTNIDAEQVLFEMTGPLNPGVFKISGDDSYLHIIMPVRVQGQE